MPIGHLRAIRAMKMGVVHGDLGEICVCWTTEGMGEDEMQEDTTFFNKTFSFTHRGGEACNRERMVCQDGKEVKRVLAWR